MNNKQIKNCIEQGLKGSKVYIDGDGSHFEAIVISDAFENKTKVAQQRLVYALLAEPLADGSLHALSLKTYTPVQWEERE